MVKCSRDFTKTCNQDRNNRFKQDLVDSFELIRNLREHWRVYLSLRLVYLFRWKLLGLDVCTTYTRTLAYMARYKNGQYYLVTNQWMEEFYEGCICSFHCFVFRCLEKKRRSIYFWDVFALESSEKGKKKKGIFNMWEVDSRIYSLKFCNQ